MFLVFSHLLQKQYFWKQLKIHFFLKKKKKTQDELFVLILVYFVFIVNAYMAFLENFVKVEDLSKEDFSRQLKHSSNADHHFG